MFFDSTKLYTERAQINLKKFVHDDMPLFHTIVVNTFIVYLNQNRPTKKNN